MQVQVLFYKFKKKEGLSQIHILLCCDRPYMFNYNRSMSPPAHAQEIYGSPLSHR